MYTRQAILKFVKLAGFLTLSNQAFAQTNYLQNCSPKGVLIGGCSFQDHEANSGASFDDVPFEAEYGIIYRFYCEGHPVQIGLQNGNTFVPFVKTQNPNETQVARIRGVGPVRVVDMNPNFTKNVALFRPGCTLEIIANEFARPSLVQLNAWTEEAKLQAKALTYAVDIFVLGNDWLRLAEWTTSQLTKVKNEVEQELNLTADEDTRENLKTILGFINNALLNQPLPPNLGDSEESLKNVVRERLQRELNVSQRILDRFDTFDAPKEPTLRAALAYAESQGTMRCKRPDSLAIFTVEQQGCHHGLLAVTFTALSPNPLKIGAAHSFCSSKGFRLPTAEEAVGMVGLAAWIFGDNVHFKIWTSEVLNGYPRAIGGNILPGADGSDDQYNMYAGPDSENQALCVKN